jgi:hypothetical protein
MGRKKHKKSDKNSHLEKIVLITAILNLIRALFDLIKDLMN